MAGLFLGAILLTWQDPRGWELYLLSSHTELERCLGRSAQKRRRLYNGTLRCELYIYRRDGGSRR